MYKKMVMISMILVVLAGMLLQGCSAVGNAVNKVATGYDEGIKVYQDSMKAAANFRLTVDTETGKMTTVVKLNDNYLVADVTKVKVYRADGASAYNNLQNMSQQYNSDGGQPLDLAKLQQSGALPSDMYKGFSLYVNVVQEAPVAAVPDKVTTQAMSIVTGAYDHINAVGRDWNDAVDAYNTWRRSVKEGRIIGDVAAYFKLEKLPDYLDYYQGNSPSNGGIPTLEQSNPFEQPTQSK
jgi:hypothetical protein